MPILILPGCPTGYSQPTLAKIHFGLVLGLVFGIVSASVQGLRERPDPCTARMRVEHQHEHTSA